MTCEILGDEPLYGIVTLADPCGSFGCFIMDEADLSLNGWNQWYAHPMASFDSSENEPEAGSIGGSIGGALQPSGSVSVSGSIGGASAGNKFVFNPLKAKHERDRAEADAKALALEKKSRHGRH